MNLNTLVYDTAFMHPTLACHAESDSEGILQRMRNVFAEEIDTFKQFKLKHYFNGYFLVFQICL
jgi:hypothetical protein